MTNQGGGAHLRATRSSDAVRWQASASISSMKTIAPRPLPCASTLAASKTWEKAKENRPSRGHLIKMSRFSGPSEFTQATALQSVKNHCLPPQATNLINPVLFGDAHTMSITPFEGSYMLLSRSILIYFEASFQQLLHTSKAVTSLSQACTDCIEEPPLLRSYHVGHITRV